MNIPRNQKSNYEHAGYGCSSCGFTTQVFGPNPQTPNECPNCGAVATLKMLWHHLVTEVVTIEDLSIP